MRDPNLTREQISSIMKPFEGEMNAHTISKLITSRTEDSNVSEVKEKREYPEIN